LARKSAVETISTFLCWKEADPGEPLKEDVEKAIAARGEIAIEESAEIAVERKSKFNEGNPVSQLPPPW
jgi:hypothetical protein